MSRLKLLPQPILDYRQPPPSPSATAALRASWMLAGTVAHGLVLALVFLTAGLRHDPFFLAFLPVALLFASAASADHRLVLRSLGQGAIFGGLAILLIGYGCGTLLLTNA